MKANKAQIERALDAPPADIRLFMLYGPDEAGSAAMARRLERAMGPNAQRIDLDNATLKGDPARLSDEAAAISMFGDKSWVRMTGVSDDIVPAVEALLDAPHAGNPVVALGGALKGTSKLVKLAIDHKAVMACVNYAPEGRDADQIAVNAARERGLRLSQELARRIISLTGGDRALIGQEVEKLALYLDAAPDRPAEATEEALNALSAESVEENIGPLVNAVLGGDVPMMTRELALLGQLGTNMGSILRPLQNRAHLLATIRAEFDRSGRLDAAVESAGKAVFWKEKGAVSRQVKLWDAAGIARVIQRLSAAERASRSSRNAGDVMVTQELVMIARQASRDR